MVYVGWMDRRDLDSRSGVFSRRRCAIDDLRRGAHKAPTRPALPPFPNAQRGDHLALDDVLRPTRRTHPVQLDPVLLLRRRRPRRLRRVPSPRLLVVRGVVGRAPKLDDRERVEDGAGESAGSGLGGAAFAPAVEVGSRAVALGMADCADRLEWGGRANGVEKVSR